MELIKEVIIIDPPTKHTKTAKRKIDAKTGKLKKTVTYLTANMFYSNVGFMLRYEIVNEVKDFLIPYFKDIPKLDKMKLELIYSRKNDNFDIDNKGYFWVKVLLDLFKTPTDNQLKKARSKGKRIKTLSILKDDTAKYFTGFSARYEKGEHKLIFKIYGNKSK